MENKFFKSIHLESKIFYIWHFNCYFFICCQIPHAYLQNSIISLDKLRDRNVIFNIRLRFWGELLRFGNYFGFNKIFSYFGCKTVIALVCGYREKIVTNNWKIIDVFEYLFIFYNCKIFIQLYVYIELFEGDSVITVSPIQTIKILKAIYIYIEFWITCW